MGITFLSGIHQVGSQDHKMADAHPRLDLDKPRYDQSTYVGRAKHFFIVTNPLNLFSSGAQLDQAKEMVENYRQGKLSTPLEDNEVWRAKHLYDSAFHPDTKEKMFILGRMSSQVPMNMVITGCLMTFYKTTPQVVFWQWANQSFNAVVNYTNRSGDAPISSKQLGLSYTAATTAATCTALGLNRMVKNLPPLIGRYVPFAAVAAANCVNIPCMRSEELMTGIPVLTKDGKRVGTSKKAAKKAITQVIFSRISMAVPAMAIPPIIMQRLERGFLQRFPVMNAPIQVGLVGLMLAFATPMCCALFPQQSSIAFSSLEQEVQEEIRSQLGGEVSHVYYNKGL